ncbi:DUF2334 domain-containing protein [Ramlibacter sp. USB13]|uniref:DUF2334 domain-containing protein n=2 Tax=Ramlibacter cellulosilyticus TaxID=2764187 RepID=A0A923MQK0_9BURK|nr:DUF2334 domain-containing protein [Ramlibacter cellulosilyticus]
MRQQLQALLNNAPDKADKATLQALATQVTQIIRTGTTTTTTTPPPASTTTPPKVLVLYDAPSGTPWDKLPQAYAIMLRNLLGHFDAAVDMVPVQQYAAGAVENYTATFYLGGIYDNQLPAAFLGDAATTTKTLVWFKYNIWQLAWNSTYNFTANRGIQYNGLKGMNAAPSSGKPNPGFFDTVKYKGLDFVKYYQYDAARNQINGDPDMGWAVIADATKAQQVVPVANSGTAEQIPYILRSGNFWYVADLPFSFIGPRDRYLVFTDLLHDMLGVNHAESHKALVRLEDVGALVSVQAMKTLSDYLGSKRIPFSVAVIPRYRDPLGAYNGGVAMEVPLSEAKNLQTAINHARTKGAELVMHGFTHQYGNMRNPHTGVSGDDYEFWNIVDNSPVQEDSTAWAYGRMSNGLTDMRAIGWNPVAWEPPHYHTSAIAARTSTQLFPVTYMRSVYYTADKPNFYASVAKDFSVGQFYPYAIGRDYYGQRIIPENLGNIEYDISTIDPTSNYNYTSEDLVTNAKYAKAVRDGYASFFFHPFWLEPNLGTPGFEDFKKTVEGISALGFTWVAPSTVR